MAKTIGHDLYFSIGERLVFGKEGVAFSLALPNASVEEVLSDVERLGWLERHGVG